MTKPVEEVSSDHQALINLKNGESSLVETGMITIRLDDGRIIEFSPASHIRCSSPRPRGLSYATKVTTTSVAKEPDQYYTSGFTLIDEDITTREEALVWLTKREILND